MLYSWKNRVHSRVIFPASGYYLHPWLTIQNELIFKGQQIVVPAVLRKELMEKTHASHIGIEGCTRRARDTLYWPRMTTEIKEYISKCDVCMTHRTSQGKEPILQHEFISRPLAKVAADLCEFDNRVLLVVRDYYSNYIKVAHLNNLTSRAVIKELKAIFARFGVPDTLVTDNGAQFSSANLPSVKWKGSEGSTDRKKLVQEVQGIGNVRVSGTSRLAQHAHGWDRNQPRPTSNGSPL